jgi:hypothetical protein
MVKADLRVARGQLTVWQTANSLRQHALEQAMLLEAKQPVRQD